jgi:SAM-dependent methyltransferase
MTARATPAGASVTRPGRSGPAGAWERAVGAFYDPFLFVGERLGMAARRRQLLVQARGEVLEIGAGTGLKRGHYPPELSGLVLTEPNEPMARRLERRATRTPFATPRDPGGRALAAVPGEAIRELRRVLRPGGRLLFSEHLTQSELR